MRKMIIALALVAAASGAALAEEKEVPKPKPKAELLSLDDYRELRSLWEEAAAKRFRDKDATGRLDSAVADRIDSILASLARGQSLEKELAAVLLPRSKDDRVPGALGDALYDEDRSVRRVAVAGLTRMKPEQLKPQRSKLLAAFKDADEVVRATAMRCIGKLKDVEDIEKLSGAFKDEVWQVRLAAVQAVGGMKDKAKDAVPALEELLSDENAYVRLFAARAIFLITGEPPAGMAGGQRKNPLKEIHGLMDQATERLEAKNVGRPTIEVQERIVVDLDKLIEALEKSQPKGGGGGGKGKGKKQQQSQGQGQGKGGKPTSGSAGGQQVSSPMQDSFTTSGSTVHGAKRAVVLEEGAEWGNLPDKLRQEVDQALKDRFPDRYKELLKRYYTRISEDEK